MVHATVCSSAEGRHGANFGTDTIFGVIQQVVENSRADSDNWWRRSTDEGTPSGTEPEPEALTGAGYSHCSARRTSSLPDTLSVAPPKDLTIPEHPGQVDSGGDEAYIQRKAVQPGHPNAVQVSVCTSPVHAYAHTHSEQYHQTRVAGCTPMKSLWEGRHELLSGGHGNIVRLYVFDRAALCMPISVMWRSIC